MKESNKQSGQPFPLKISSEKKIAKFDDFIYAIKNLQLI
jgi:hypothetical protein